MPFFSIITVTRDNLDGLIKTRESLTRQYERDFEWIVVDGASADFTPDYLRGTNARFISEKDAGIYDAMNKGAAMASGDYMLFLNAGDCLAAPDVLGRTKALCARADRSPSLIYGDALEELSPGGRVVYKTAKPVTSAARGMFTHHQAMFYEREIARHLRYDTRYDIAADYKYTLEFIAQARAALYLPFAVCLFEAGGVSMRETKEGRREQFRIRHETGTGGLAANIATYARQSLAQRIRSFSPALYSRLRGNALN